VAGLSIEDACGHHADPLWDVDTAARRVAVARKAIDATGAGVMLTGRAECFLHGESDVRVAIRRLRAYADAVPFAEIDRFFRQDRPRRNS
jgi:2-methylisocitrate lyase-like PEP mutase family enzyme